MTPPVIITEQYLERTLGECDATELYTAEQVCAEKSRRWVNWVSSLAVHSGPVTLRALPRCQGETNKVPLGNACAGIAIVYELIHQ